MKNREIRTLLFERELKQRDLAKELGVAEETLSRLLAKDLSREKEVQILAAIFKMSKPPRTGKRRTCV